ncbi:MAG: NAD(P)-dependent oxidoreductase [Candidatus Heimdallarchaeota archaeon]
MTDGKSITALFFWNVPERLQIYLKKGLENYPQVNLIFPEDISQESLIKLAPEADIIIGWRPTKNFLDAATILRLFINPGVGVQHLTDLFKELNQTRKITLVNGHGNTYFTAQHAVALLLSLTNKIISHHNWMAEGEWRKGDDDARSKPMRDRKIGLLGYGAVNTKVHKFLSGFDVEFHILKRDWSRERVANLPTKIEKYSIDELSKFLEVIDTVIVAVPLTSKTNGLIGKKELEQLGAEGLLVTVARGEVIDEESLYLALKNKIIAGAAIDVWYNYRPEPDEHGRKHPAQYPFYELDNVILSPHRGASPMNDLKRWDEVVDNISRVARNEKKFLNEVDLENEY